MWQILANVTNRFIVIAILVMGVSVGLARLLMPLAAEYHTDIETALTEAVGRKVTVQTLHARWYDFGPQLVLRDIALETRQGAASPIRLSEIRIGFSLFDSIAAGAPVPDMVALVKAHLRLRQLKNGSIKLLGINDFDLNGSNGAGAEIKQLPLAVGLIDSEITLETPRSTEPLRLYNLNLKLKQRDDHYKVGATLQIGGHTANQIEMSANLYGKPTDADGWRSDFHLSGKALALDALMKHFIPRDFRQVSGLAEFELWGKLQQGKLKSLEGDFSLRGVTIEKALPSGHSSYNINQLLGQFRWLRKQESWRLELVDFQLKRNETLWPKSAITIQAGLDEERQPHLEVSAGFLRLQDLLSATTLMPAAKQGALKALQQLRPAGDLRDLRFSFKDDALTPRWHLTGIAERFRVKAWKNFPGVNGLSLSFTANQQGGAAIFNSKEVVLSFNTANTGATRIPGAPAGQKNTASFKTQKSSGLFRNAIRLKRVAGPVYWNKRSNGWKINSASITVDTPDFNTHTRFSLHLPRAGSPYLDLQTNLNQGDITYVRNYLPAGIMNNGVINWLDRALVSGRVHAGTLLIRGPLDDFPFEQKTTGRMEALLEIEDAILNYNTGWPRLERMTAELRFLNNSFSARIFDAEIYAGRVVTAEARIERLDPVSPLLLDCVVDAPLADYLRVLTDTPLSKQFGRRASKLNSKEEARLAFRLDQPLGKKASKETKILGFVEFKNNVLKTDGGDVHLSDLTGKLHFDRQKVWAKRLKAKALGSMLTLDIKSPKRGPKRTEIDVRGRYRINNLLDRYVGVPLKHIKGKTDWHLNIRVPHSSRGSDLPNKLTLTSKLRGISIKMPPPFGKKANERKQLRIQLSTAKPNRTLPIRIKLGDIADSYLLMGKSLNGQRKMERAEIRLGGGRAKRPKTPGLHLKGSLSNFQLDPWMEMFQKGKRNAAPPIDLQMVNVDFGRFEYNNFWFDNILIQGGPTASGWSGKVDSPQIKGLIKLPKNLKKGTIRLDLEHFGITTDKTENEKPQLFNKFDPRKLPSLHATSKSLLFNEKNLGAITLRISKHRRGVRFDQADIKSDWFNLTAKGSWLMNRAIPNTAMNFKMETSKLERLMEALGFTANIKKAPGRLKGNLQWPGDPTDINNLWLSGNLDLSLKKGSFVDINPGAGRIFGLLNLGALHRRLTFDFSDVFGKGLSFDKIEGSFTLDNGDAYTHDLSIEGPTGIINVSGRTGLVSHDFDQLVTVIPDVTGTLATVGALAAGPVVGAALYLTNKVVGKKLNKVSTTQYQVQGPWDKPEIKSDKKTRQKTQQQPRSFDLDRL